MAETPVNKLPYPVDADSPNAPAQMKALAELLDTLGWGSRNLKPTAGIKRITAAQALTGSFADLAGVSLTLTPAVASTLLVVANFALSGKAANAEPSELLIEPRILVDGASHEDLKRGAFQTVHATVKQLFSNVSYVWPAAIPLTAAEHTVKAQAKITTGTEGNALAATSMLYLLIAS